MSDFLHEHHETRDHQAMTRLSGRYDGFIEEAFAALHNTGATLYKVKTGPKPTQKRLKLSPAEMDALTEAWTQFKANCAAWETAEREHKAFELAKEQTRQADVWQEIYRLGATVPGLEIVAREAEDIDYDTGKAETRTVYDVKLASVGHSPTGGVTSVDEVLESVQFATARYGELLSVYENDEKEGWPNPTQRRWIDETIASGKAFLSQHRAWLALQAQEEPCKDLTNALCV